MSSAANSPFEVWGLTGGIASGKSTAARLFAELGVPVIDADQIARDLSQPGGAAHAAILKRFGTDDRKRLREIVFASPEARKDLEALLHPLIQAESAHRMQTLATQRALGHNKLLILYEATLLVETGRYRELDGLIVVEAPREKRLQRLTARDGISLELAHQILASQISDPERAAVATHVIRNDSTPEELREKVNALYKLLQAS